MEIGHNEGRVIFVQVVGHNHPWAVPGRPTWLRGAPEARLPVVRPSAPGVVVAAQLLDLSLPHRPPLAPADQEEDDQEEEDSTGDRDGNIRPGSRGHTRSTSCTDMTDRRRLINFK